MTNQPGTTCGLLTRLRAHSGPAIMGCTCRSTLANCPACDCGHAADEIERLLALIERVEDLARCETGPWVAAILVRCKEALERVA